jgi:trehalose 6-phosphate phosphatase
LKNVLSPAGRRSLREFAEARVLLAFDFDGTLAPIVRSPDRARMRPATGRLLQRVAARYPCVILSGRARADVRKRLCGAPVREVVGSHGAEPRRPPPGMTALVRRWRRKLERRLAAFPAAWIEDKTYSLAVHYRGARDGGRTRAAIREAVAGLDGARLTGGKQVVNVVPRTAPHKGLALERQRRRLRCDRVIYVGDDETDEDVFAGGRSRILGIRVGFRSGSAAACYLRTQADVDRLLGALADASPRRRAFSSAKKGRPLPGPS